MYYLQILLLIEPKILSITSSAYNKFLIISHKNYFKLVQGIHQLFLIQRANVTNLNFTVSPTHSLYMFLKYSKLSYDPTSLQLVLCFFILVILKEVIFFNFFYNTSYKTKIPRLFKRVIISTLTPIKYKYNIIKSGDNYYYYNWLICKKLKE